jgi:hypothetical protein
MYKTLLGTQYITIKTSEVGVHINLAPEMCIFGVLSIILMVLTMTIWVVWDRHSRLTDLKNEKRVTGEKVV